MDKPGSRIILDYAENPDRKEVDFMLRKMLAGCLAIMLLACAAMAETIIPYGEELQFETQVTSEGVARLHGESDYETLSFTIRLTANHGPMHFKKYYGGDFALKGNEAVVKLELRLNDAEGLEINPNRVILLTMQAENGETASGYQMMDWEMGGNTEFTLGSKPISVFKRYDFDEEDENPMRYLVVHSFNDGVEETYLMELADPEKEGSFYIVYPELKRKSRGQAVKELQARLKEMGLLTGSSVDGVYGPGTAESVKVAQKLLGFEETGVATHEFQKALYKFEIGE